MPLTRISMLHGKTEKYRQAIFDSLCRALHETFNVPEDNQFMVIHEHEPASYRYPEFDTFCRFLLEIALKVVRKQTHKRSADFLL